jgi:uncharacterized OsmC-like protein
MQAFPHTYTVTAVGFAEGDVEVSTDRVERLRSASAADFGGQGDRWSPETLLVGALGDCLVLTFRAIARASQLPWTSLRCGVTGILDRIDNVTQFTAFNIQARLDVPAGTDPARARRVLDRSQRNCLVACSLKAPIRLLAAIEVAAECVS